MPYRTLQSPIYRRWHRAAAVAAAFLVSPPAWAESRSYAVTWFAEATSSQDGDCVGGLNLTLEQQYSKDLLALGYTGPQTEELMKQYNGEGVRDWDADVVRNMMNARARVNGKPANAFANPAAVADPHLKYVTGKYAHGFNLDGKGADDKTAFEDPVTHEKGIDNQLFRALGCIDPFRGTIEHDTAFWAFMWMAEKDSTPAWLVTIEGADLDKDGPVTVKLSRALETAKYNSDGSPRADMTYREDPDPRVGHNLYKGEIRNRVVTITEPMGALHMMHDQLTYPYFDLKSFHVRLSMGEGGALTGLLGGYQPIEQVYFALSQGGIAAESNYAPELPGMYHLLRKLADADPDPKTGQNWSISATYHIKAVQAFVVPAKDKVPAVALR